MTFVTVTYLLFFPLVVAVYWSLPGRRARNLLLVVASYAFYSWWDYRFSALLLSSTLVDYLIGRALGRTDVPGHRRVLVAASVTLNLGLLGFFKYYNFFIDTLIAALGALGLELSPSTLSIILPVGISFYTFQTLSYTIDIYRGKLTPCASVIDYAAYVAFFPQLVAGPIERGIHLVPQFQRDRRFEPHAAVEGCRYILWGLFKKVAVADNLALLVDAAYSDPGAAGSVALVVATVAFAFQIYCDFSGYSDIAIGCSRFFGIFLMRNFAYPYFSRSLAEFWRRWHISLSTWFRDYLYIPLGGSRGSRARVARNLFVTFVVSGLWHGAAWNFVIWGAINGVVLASFVMGHAKDRQGPADIPGGDRLIPGARDLTSMVRTFAIVCIAWVFFRAESIGDAATILSRVFTLAPGGTVLQLAGSRGIAGLGLMALVIGVEWAQREHQDVLYFTSLPRYVRWTVYTVISWASVMLMPPVVSPFIYFQF